MKVNEKLALHSIGLNYHYKKENTNKNWHALIH